MLDPLDTLPEWRDEYPTLGYQIEEWSLGVATATTPAAVSARFFVPAGPLAGKPFTLTDRQWTFLMWWYALAPDGEFLMRGGSMRHARGTGKSPTAGFIGCAELCGPVRFDRWDDEGQPVGARASMPLVQVAAVSEAQPVDVNEVVPTPAGWSTVGDLQVGNEVFGSDGVATRVERTTDVMLGERCYRVTFDDGASLVTSAGHTWTLERLNGHGDEYESADFTTEQISGDYLLGSKRRKRYRVGTASIEMPPVALPVDPWFLGLWLGDGTARDAKIAFDWDLRDEYETLLKPLLNEHEEIVWRQWKDTRQGTFRIRQRRFVCPRGHDYSEDYYSHYKHKTCRQCHIARNSVGKTLPPRIRTFRERLREAGVLNNKHIPITYMRSSFDQRWALLQGLIDSDGGISPKGRVSFTNADERLFDDVVELIVSLGMRVSIQPAAGTARRVFFTPGDDRPVARLAYKAARQLPHDLVRGRSQHRWIAAIEEVDSVPVRCIGLNTSDHLFQVGRSHILTHNCDHTMQYVRAWTAKGSPLQVEYNLDPGKQVIYSPGDGRAAGGKLAVITSSSATARGATPSLVLADETGEWTGSNGGTRFRATLGENAAKVTGSRVLECANSWRPGAGSVAESRWDAWTAEQEDEAQTDRPWLMDVREAPADTDWSDPDSIRAGVDAVYEPVPWQTAEQFMPTILDPAKPIQESMREFGNLRVSDLSSWVSAQDWDACARPDEVLADGDEVVLFCDPSETDDATALVACRVSDGLVDPVWVHEPAVSGDVDPAELDRQVRLAFDRFTVLGFFSDVRPMEQLVRVEWPQRYGDALVVWPSRTEAVAYDMRRTQSEYAQAAELTASEIERGELIHTGDSVLARHVYNTQRRPHRSYVSVGKGDRARKIDGCVAMIGARMLRKMLLDSPGYARHRRRRAVTDRNLILR